jgi:hypothetical protein
MLRNETMGAPSFAAFCEGWVPRISTKCAYWAPKYAGRKLWYPPFAKNAKGWGTHSFVAEHSLDKSDSALPAAFVARAVKIGSSMSCKLSR